MTASLNPNPMAPRVWGVLLAALFYLLPGTCLGLTDDGEQPIEIEADSAELDEKRGVVVYEGSVVVVQGSMRLTADRLTIYYDESQNLDRAYAVGKPARFQQRKEAGHYVKARALEMEFHSAESLLYLIREARVTEKGDTVTGNRIVYNTATQRATATGSKTGKERVRVILSPKKSNSPPPPDPSPAR